MFFFRIASNNVVWFWNVTMWKMKQKTIHGGCPQFWLNFNHRLCVRIFFKVSFEILTWILMYDTSHGTSIAPNKTHTIAISYTLRNWKHFIFYLYLKCVFLFIQTSPLWNEANKTSRANSMQNIKREKKNIQIHVQCVCARVNHFFVFMLL